MLNQCTHCGLPRLCFTPYSKGPETEAGKPHSYNIPSSGMDVSMQCLVYCFVSSKSGFQALLLEDYDLGIQNEWLFQSTPDHVSCFCPCEEVLSRYLFQLMWPKQSNVMVVGIKWQATRGAVVHRHVRHILTPPKMCFEAGTVGNDCTE